jgi:hypothetical protein
LPFPRQGADQARRSRFPSGWLTHAYGFRTPPGPVGHAGQVAMALAAELCDHRRPA